MSIDVVLFAIAWAVLIVVVLLAVAIFRWLRLRDDVVRLARRDRRRAEED